MSGSVSASSAACLASVVADALRPLAEDVVVPTDDFSANVRRFLDSYGYMLVAAVLVFVVLLKLWNTGIGKVLLVGAVVGFAVFAATKNGAFS